MSIKIIFTLAGFMAVTSPAEAGDRNETKELRDFIGAVYDKRGSWTLTSGENALSDRGCIRKVGNNFFTPEGCYRKVGNTYFTPDGEAVVTTGKTYLGSGRNKVSAGSTVLDAEDGK